VLNLGLPALERLGSASCLRAHDLFQCLYLQPNNCGACLFEIGLQSGTRTSTCLNQTKAMTGPSAAGGRPRLAMRAFSSNRAPSPAFACQSPVFARQAGWPLWKRLPEHRLAPIVNAGRARLRAIGERLKQIGQLGVAMLFHEPPHCRSRDGRTARIRSTAWGYEGRTGRTAPSRGMGSGPHERRVLRVIGLQSARTPSAFSVLAAKFMLARPQPSS
jgi:hypothetical protein